MTAPTSRWRSRVADAIDRRLGPAGRAVGGPLAAAVLAGAGQSAAVVVQAVLLATVIERGLEHGAGVASVRGPLIGLGVALGGAGAARLGGRVGRRPGRRVGDRPASL